MEEEGWRAPGGGAPTGSRRRRQNRGRRASGRASTVITRVGSLSAMSKFVNGVKGFRVLHRAIYRIAFP